MGKECFVKYSDVKYHKMKIENIFICNFCCFVESINFISNITLMVLFLAEVRNMTNSEKQ